MHSPCITDGGTDTSMDTSIDSGVDDRTCVSCSTGLSYALTAVPFGLIHHYARMRQTTNVPHLHLQVVSCFEDVNCLIVRNSDKTLTIDLQDLITHLQETSLNGAIL